MKILIYFIAFLSACGWCYAGCYYNKKIGGEMKKLNEIENNSNNLQYDDSNYYHIINEKIDF